MKMKRDNATSMKVRISNLQHVFDTTKDIEIRKIIQLKLLKNCEGEIKLQQYRKMTRERDNATSMKVRRCNLQHVFDTGKSFTVS